MIRKFNQFISRSRIFSQSNEELTILKGPSDHEIINALEGLSAQEVFKQCRNHKLGDLGFQIAVDKGLLEDLSIKEIFFKAAEGGSLKYLVKCLQDGININAKESLGIDKNGHSRFGNTALLYAANYGYFNIVEYLIENGADVNIRNINGWTPLMYASRDGYFNIVKCLVENGAKLDIINPIHDCDALSYAETNNHNDIAKYLKNKIIESETQ
jgi:ankyrin repeat protein